MRRRVPFGLLIVAAAGIGAGIFAFASPDTVSVGSVGRSANCNIKGNVSIDSGERIYHVPGQRYYDATRIAPEYGERWFCSEAEAREAGWRKSGV